MICPRCGKEMLRQYVSTAEGALVMWRCLWCGEYLDPVVVKNRKAPPAPDYHAKKIRRSMVFKT